MNAIYLTARGLVVGFVLFGLVGYVQLLAGWPLLAAELPAAWLSGIAASWYCDGRSAGVATATGSGPTWLPVCTAAVVLVGVVLLIYGALATPARAWDGTVAWELKARALSQHLALDNALFGDPAAFHHSPSYPLLQPLCIASLTQWLGNAGSRLLFPLLWLLFLGVGGGAVARHRSARTPGLLIVLALATTPFFLDTSGGAADSGYAEQFFAVAVTAVGAGLLLRDAMMLTAAVALLPLLKPEGAVLAVLLPIVPFVLAERRSRWWWGAPALTALTLAEVVVAASVLTRREFDAGGSALLLAAGTALALAVLLVLLRCGLDRFGGGLGLRLGVLVALGVGGVGLLVSLPPDLAGTALGQFVVGFERIGAKLAHLPAVLLGLLQYLTAPKRFGLTFVIALLVLLVHRRRALAAPANLVGAWLGSGLLVVGVAFLLSPESDVEHHLKSSAPRLLSHWTGVAWLWIAAVWPASQDGPHVADGRAGEDRDRAGRHAALAATRAQPSSN